MATQQQLVNIIEPAVSALDFELWGCELIHHGNKRDELWVYVDRESGVTLDDCAEVSRQVAAVLDVEDLISAPYQLQVSSPGMDRGLFTLDHYQRLVGCKIKCRLRFAKSGRRNFIGVISAVDGEQISLQLPDDQITIQFNEIERANVIPEF